MQKYLRLEFVPVSVDLGLLVLRVSLGLSMLVLHGWGKLSSFSLDTKFPDPLGVSPVVSHALAAFAEGICTVLLVLGLWTRLSAFFLVCTMAVAFFISHGARLSGPGNGELAFVYLVGYAVLLIAGGGKFSIDRK